MNFSFFHGRFRSHTNFLSLLYTDQAKPILRKTGNGTLIEVYIKRSLSEVSYAATILRNVERKTEVRIIFHKNIYNFMLPLENIIIDLKQIRMVAHRDETLPRIMNNLRNEKKNFQKSKEPPKITTLEIYLVIKP